MCDMTAQLNELVAQAVRTARESANLSQLELARRSGTTRSTIANIESGRQSVTLDLALRLVNGLGIDLESFLTPEMWEAVRVRVPDILPEGLPDQDRVLVGAALDDLLR